MLEQWLIQVDEHIFSNGLVQPPTRSDLEAIFEVVGVHLSTTWLIWTFSNAWLLGCAFLPYMDPMGNLCFVFFVFLFVCQELGSIHWTIWFLCRLNSSVYIYIYMGVSKNSGTPKWMVWRGYSLVTSAWPGVVWGRFSLTSFLLNKNLHDCFIQWVHHVCVCALLFALPIHV